MSEFVPPDIVPPLHPSLMPVAARLHLLAALRRQARLEVPTGLEMGDWEALFRGLTSEQRIVAVLVGICGVSQLRVLEMLNDDRGEAMKVGRGRVNQIWKDACDLLRANAEALLEGRDLAKIKSNRHTTGGHAKLWFWAIRGPKSTLE